MIQHRSEDVYLELEYFYTLLRELRFGSNKPEVN